VYGRVVCFASEINIYNIEKIISLKCKLITQMPNIDVDFKVIDLCGKIFLDFIPSYRF
jgi:hypothetical protein